MTGGAMIFYKSLFYNTYLSTSLIRRSGKCSGLQNPSNVINALNYGRFFRAFNDLLAALQQGTSLMKKAPALNRGLIIQQQPGSTANRRLFFLFLFDILEDVLVLLRIRRFG